MLSNNLTLDEEDAVQADLQELQAHMQDAESQPIELPTAPSTAPVETVVERSFYLFFPVAKSRSYLRVLGNDVRETTHDSARVPVAA